MSLSFWMRKRILRGLINGLLLGLIFIALLHFLDLWLVLPLKCLYHGASTKSGLRYAFATLLLPQQLSNNSTRGPTNSDPYLESTRLLNYQLRHSKETRGSGDLPLLVLVTSDFPRSQREQLTREGAKILEIKMIEAGSGWIRPGAERWKGVMAKLRLFEITDFDRILFLDADTFLLKPLGAIFQDPAVKTAKTLRKPAEVDEAPLPSHYVFATLQEALHTAHPYPLQPWPYFNAGFFVLQPSLELFDYYLSLLDLPGRFDSTYPEQNMLNYAHREDGNMPWQRLHHKWNINLPNMEDVKKGVSSVHAKLWTDGNDLQPIDPQLQTLWKQKMREMKNYYRNSHKERDKKSS